MNSRPLMCITISHTPVVQKEYGSPIILVPNDASEALIDRSTRRLRVPALTCQPGLGSLLTRRRSRHRRCGAAVGHRTHPNVRTYRRQLIGNGGTNGIFLLRHVLAGEVIGRYCVLVCISCCIRWRRRRRRRSCQRGVLGSSLIKILLLQHDPRVVKRSERDSFENSSICGLIGLYRGSTRR